MSQFEIIDFHTHVLPGIDDGAADAEMSVQMLEMLKKQGADVVIASAHFYRELNTVDEFCNNRNRAYEELTGHILSKGLELPRIIPAAEVKLYHGLGREKELEKLCVGDSDVILIEMPYEKWSPWMFSEIYSVCARGLIPVMVHVERYFKVYANEDDILKKLLGMRVFAQCNCEGIRQFRKRRLVRSIIMMGKLIAIGSDAHNISDRKPNIDLACKFLCKKYDETFLKALMRKAARLLEPGAHELL